MGNLNAGKTTTGTHYTEIPTSKFSKYIGKRKLVVFRSSWELGFVKGYLEPNKSILGWSSEEVVIKYNNPILQRPARYFVDFFVKYITPNGEKCSLIEIKPYHETIKPKITEGMSDKTKHYVLNNFYVNQSKWHSARNYASSKGWNFIIITEKQLVFNSKS